MKFTNRPLLEKLDTQTRDAFRVMNIPGCPLMKAIAHDGWIRRESIPVMGVAVINSTRKDVVKSSKMLCDMIPVIKTHMVGANSVLLGVPVKVVG